MQVAVARVFGLGPLQVGGQHVPGDVGRLMGHVFMTIGKILKAQGGT